MKREQIDFDRIRRDYDLTTVARSYGLELRQNGNEWIAKCPFHGETAGSFSIYVTADGLQRFKCFGCDAQGDVIDFVSKMDNVGPVDAVRSLTGETGTARPRPRSTPAPSPVTKPAWEQLRPVPPDASRPIDDSDRAFFRHPRHGLPAMVWTYRDASGGLLGYVTRYNKPDGGKEVLPFCYGREGDGPARWRFKAFTEPRPLYGLDRLAAKPSAQVLIVEGEKTADAAARLFPGLAVVSWPGGGKAVGKADWTPLLGRKVCIWPDADSQTYGDTDARAGSIKPLDQQAGTATALKIAGILRDSITDYVRIVRLPDPRHDDSPRGGWDLADAEAEGWDTARASAFIKAHVCDPWEPEPDAPQTAKQEPVRPQTARPEPARSGPQDGPPAVDPDDPGPQEAPEYDPGVSDTDWTPPPLPEDPEMFDWPFQCLGHAGGVYYFLPRSTGAIVDLTPGAMSKAAMFQLAPLSWWVNNFPAKNGVAWQEVADALIARSHAVGFYNPLRVRGRGAWIDDGRAVVHLGDRLCVDGVETPIHEMRTGYIYEAGAVAEARTSAPATAREAHRLVELCEMLSWERPIFGKLLAGWCAVAHVCGALRWRPHLWITGPSGAGKSWVYDNILRQSLDGYALACQSNTTEAGLRQALGNDAQPVIFDEAESETQRGRDRIRNVLELMRQASSDNGAAIFKGTATGRAQQFRIRSVFAFCSIVVAADSKADLSRVTILTLRPYTGADREARFQAIQALAADVMTPAFVSRLRSRSVSLIHQIRANGETFAQAAAARLGSRRYGDQVGALLAGAYSLHSDREISLEDAQAWVNAQSWDEQREAPEDADESRLLLHILQQQVTIETSTGPAVRREIGEIVRRIVKGRIDPLYSQTAAEDALARFGIRFKGGFPSPILIISNNHGALKRCLESTPWPTGWGRLLLRIKGAEKTSAVRFAGTVSKAVMIPITSTPINDSDQNDQK